MTAELFLPYQNSMSLDINDNLNDYYKTPQDYANALTEEDRANGMMVYNTMSRGFATGTYYGSFDKIVIPKEIEDRIVFAKAECLLMTPDARFDETVDTMIDKFASQKEFLFTAHFDMKVMDGEFEEEILQWSRETLNILKVGRDISRKEGSDAGDQWVETNIPKKDLRLSFNNKSGKRVSFVLRGCEIEQKVAKNRYIFYVRRMEILK